MWRELMIPRALCVHAMPGHRRVTRVRRKFSFELQKLQLRAPEPVRLQSADWFIKAARAITSRHAESQVQPTKRFPHRRNPLPHLRFVYARTDQLQRVLHVRVRLWERTYDTIVDTWKVGRTGSSCSLLAMHGERNTAAPRRPHIRGTRLRTRAFQDSRPVRITNYGVSCLTKSRTYLCLVSKYAVNRTASLAILDKAPKLFYWLIERRREYVIPRLSVNWIRFLDPATPFVSF